jgi:hypothetical protein
MQDPDQIFVSTETVITDFWLSRWLTVDVKSAVGCLHCVNIGRVADILEIGDVSIFRVKVFMEVSFCVYVSLYSYFLRARCGSENWCPHPGQ